MKEIEFISELKKLGIDIKENQLIQLEQYYNLLIEWNKVMNLTTITERNEVYLKHFYDSTTIHKIVDLKGNYSLCDIGTGAGFPGIVLKIIFPNLKITLVDSLQKRIKFLNVVIDDLKLENIEAIHERAEIFGITHREEYDIVTARAVAALNVLLEYAIPPLKVGGMFVPLKSNIIEEIELSKIAMTKLDCFLEQQEIFLLPIESSNRTLLKIVKNKKSKKTYPRKFAEIKKNPL